MKSSEGDQVLPMVTIIVPHYNRNVLLPALISNVAEQTYRPLELIIVDDGSDATPLLQFEAKESSLKYYKYLSLLIYFVFIV